MPKLTIGEFLADIRKEQGMTQKFSVYPTVPFPRGSRAGRTPIF